MPQSFGVGEHLEAATPKSASSCTPSYTTTVCVYQPLHTYLPTLLSSGLTAKSGRYTGGQGRARQKHGVGRLEPCEQRSQETVKFWWPKCCQWIQVCQWSQDWWCTAPDTRPTTPEELVVWQSRWSSISWWPVDTVVVVSGSKCCQWSMHIIIHKTYHPRRVGGLAVSVVALVACGHKNWWHLRSSSVKWKQFENIRQTPLCPICCVVTV